jgi:hypothetical protein
VRAYVVDAERIEIALIQPAEMLLDQPLVHIRTALPQHRQVGLHCLF